MFALALSGISDLAAELRRPIVGVALERLPNGPVTAAAIVRPDGSRLVVTSRVNDVGPRAEMGSLEIALRSGDGPLAVDLPLSWLGGPESVSKLLARLDGEEAEAGLVLRGPGGTSLTLASGVYPHSLHVAASDLLDEGELEFEEHEYRLLPFG
ncbi:hypothetical protein [Aureimonas sp. ME7]|uniref:hypothetical protein n=1 Tax=Aureimonas sp. ME7 TaxID=2744252 RepID=UPI0015F59133|nr:hypothetical protein [Aureimonas sp. ME7]